MTWALATVALRERLAANMDWPIQYPNQKSEPYDEDTDAGKVNLTELAEQGQQVGLGLRRHRYPGIAVAQLFVPLLTGNGAINTKASALVAAFRAVSLTDITFTTSWADPIGRTPNGKWYQVNVNIPFYFDSTDN